MNPVLIIEDDTNINNLLKEALEKAGFDCAQAFSGTEAKMLLEAGKYSVVLLDLMLPGISGEEVLKVIREQGKIPVIVLTARDDLEAKVDILTGGADDYITKPFEIKEVIARIQVQFRHAGPEQEGHLLNYNKLVLDRESFSVEIQGKQLPKITKQEFLILELLLKYPKKVFSKEEMFEYAWEQSYMGETKTLDVHISNIRKKIREITEEEYIETVWGIGYRLHP